MSFTAVLKSCCSPVIEVLHTTSASEVATQTGCYENGADRILMLSDFLPKSGGIG
jgi:hypothetical protein